MTTKIVLIPVDYYNSRKVCEIIDGQTFDTESTLTKKLKDSLDVPEDEKVESPLIYGISEFVDAVNDQQLDVLSEYFIAHVIVA